MDRLGDLSDLKNIMPQGGSEPPLVAESRAPSEKASRPVSLDPQGRAYATGKRKTAVARLWLKPGKGVVTVNGRSFDDYFPSSVRSLVMRPLDLLEATGRFDVMCTVKGSGISGQGGAVRHALAQALAIYKTDAGGALKKEGLLTLDARIVERKKPGLAKARKRYQRSKR